LVAPSGIAIASNGDIFILDKDADAVIRVDPSSGTQTLVSSGGFFVGPLDLAIAANGDIFVVDPHANLLIRVDPTSGAQTIVSSGGNFTGPYGIAIAGNGDILIGDSNTNLGSRTIIRVDPTSGAQTVVSSGGVLATPGGLAIVPKFTEFFLHSVGSALVLDESAPTATTAQFKDSAGIHLSGGNPWKEIGTWTASLAGSAGTLISVSDLHVWLGLKNSDDIGTRFDLRAEVLKNGSTVASGETFCLTGVTRNPALAKESDRR
jgi:streptogramin lyase